MTFFPVISQTFAMSLSLLDYQDANLNYFLELKNLNSEVLIPSKLRPDTTFQRPCLLTLDNTLPVIPHHKIFYKTPLGVAIAIKTAPTAAVPLLL